MFREEKNLKDPKENSLKDTSSVPAPHEAEGFRSGSVSVSYTKTDKLITALYMVTDIIDKDEPLRNKLRTLGAEIVSDMNSSPMNACSKISETMSFLDIASAINIISPMNSSILKKEFLKLDQAIKEFVAGVINPKRQISLAEFFVEELPEGNQVEKEGQGKSIGHAPYARIGVQRGGTLMKALRKIEMSDRKPTQTNAADFNILKKQRRVEISNFLQKSGGNATITDIKNGALSSLVSCGEKTLQRELVSMVKNGVLKKTGEKRWSKYSLVGRIS